MLGILKNKFKKNVILISYHFIFERAGKMFLKIFLFRFSKNINSFIFQYHRVDFCSMNGFISESHTIHEVDY